MDPTSLTTAYLRGATQRGATLAEGCRVQEVVVEAGRVAGVRSVVAAAAFRSIASASWVHQSQTRNASFPVGYPRSGPAAGGC